MYMGKAKFYQKYLLKYLSHETKKNNENDNKNILSSL